MHIRPVTHSDIPAFASAVTQSMWDDEVMAYTSPQRDIYPLSFERHVLYRALRRFYAGQFLFLIVSDSSDTDWAGHEVVMGYCCYSTNVRSTIKPCPGGWLGNAFERWALDVWHRYANFLHLDWSADPAAEVHFRTVCEKDMFEDYFASLPAEHKLTKSDEHWELELLGTIPQFRRRGVGREGLLWGFEKCRADNVPLILTSSIAGERLYNNMGFRVVEEIDMLPGDGTDGGNLGKATRERFAETDFGLGVGKGLSWKAMVWEPENLRQKIEQEIAKEE